MAFYEIRMANKIYEVNDITDNVGSTHDALLSLSFKARLYSLTRREGTNDVFVASIVGDKCIDLAMNESRYTFAVFDDSSSLSSDKIAVTRALQYLNNEEYKKAVKK